jgi:hypothetical protein
MLAHQLMETVGMGPYEVGPLDVGSRSEGGRYRKAFVINGWEIGLVTERIAEVIGEQGEAEAGAGAAQDAEDEAHGAVEAA